MADYISLKMANKVLRECVRAYPNSFYQGIEAARTAINKLPAADVRPVEKAEWIECYNPYDRAIWIKCSACSGWGSFTNEGYNHRSFFCPNCGADMREAVKDG